VTTDEIDRILSSEPGLEPSSGFVRAVMQSVHLEAEAAATPPLRFPWGRFAFGLAACLVLAAAGTLLAPQIEAWLPAVAAPFAPIGTVAPELGYAALALIASLTIARLPRLFARG
jgi:hypothetical protein